MTCRVVCGRQLTFAFPVKTGVRQGCLLLLFLYLLTVDRLGVEDIPRREMEFRGLLGSSFMTWTLQMIWFSSPIPTDRCKRRPTRLQIIQLVLI